CGIERRSLARSVIGFGRQEVHFVLGGDADDFCDIRQIVKLIEQRFEFLRRRHPEQRPRRLVRLVEKPCGMPRGSRTRSPVLACTQTPSSFRSSMPSWTRMNSSWVGWI